MDIDSGKVISKLVGDIVEKNQQFLSETRNHEKFKSLVPFLMQKNIDDIDFSMFDHDTRLHLLNALGAEHLKTFLFHGPREDGANACLVVGYQDLGHTGKYTENTVPFPFSLFTSISPSCSSTIR